MRKWTKQRPKRMNRSFSYRKKKRNPPSGIGEVGPVAQLVRAVRS
jgi:hypothetical protein